MGEPNNIIKFPIPDSESGPQISSFLTKNESVASPQTTAIYERILTQLRAKDFHFESSDKKNYINTPLKYSRELKVDLPKKGDSMDESTKMMLERLERDSREREERYHKDAQEREQRFRDEVKEQADLYRTEAKEREERIEKMINGLSTEIKEIRSEASQTTKHVQSMVTSNTWGFIATVLAIVALAVTLFIALSPQSNNGQTSNSNPTKVESTK
ncbi:hypothetical protein HUB98_08955 [Paenibacillus barcinonensis]|uniref:Uncharacterized protein n=1 Tax=Paenibacillus barcinonensis TaxID=198119 RepID=A0A2V4VMN8_PAEBA|nr:hypothetical protein [Paenibacillus barcinonensis]PYE47552.1 hypothetical protein DFQ00_113146 [Paenibacillus barcinonensis]QKS56456.1 hypothetical protein HUB98_08955 [Paenibacillus barcinonensis]